MEVQDMYLHPDGVWKVDKPKFKVSGKSIWLDLIGFFNSKKVGDKVSRVELKDILSRYKLQFSTVDNYRNYLTKAGFLKTIFVGHYTIMKPIPDTLTVDECKDLAYGIDSTLKKIAQS